MVTHYRPPLAVTRAIQLATRLARTGDVPRARAVIAGLPSRAAVVIEVNETVPVGRRPAAPRPPSTAWIAEMRAAQVRL